MIHWFAYIGVAVILFMYVYFYKRRSNTSLLAVAPGILITTGILFTFLGIALGLFSFDVNNVDQSLPALLDGIKTAFWASAAGVASALLLKFSEISHIKQNSDDSVKEGQTIDDIVAHQTKQIHELVENNKIMQSILGSIAGSEDSSLVAQVKLLRMDSNEKLEKIMSISERHNQELITEFREFAKTMAENNSKAFIEALKDVIRDFNQKITDQFGDNFKQLNEAVGRTVEWQENYRIQMQESISLLTAVTQSLGKQVEDYSIVVNNSTHFENHATSMSQLIDAINTQRNQMETLITSLAGMVDSTSKELPKIGQMTNDMIQKTSDSALSLITSMEDMNKQTLKSTDQIIASLQDNNKQIVDSLSENNNKLIEQLSTSIKHSTDEIQQQTRTLEETLANELKRSLETLGQQLASLSNKFVEDYTPLTERLKEVVQMASNVR